MMRYLIVLLAIVAAFLVQSSLPSALTGSDSAEESLGFQRTEPPAALRGVRFADARGAPVSLADKRGRVVVMNFWATWCPPCVREMPSLDRLQAKFDKSVLEVVLISEDRDAGVIEPFYRRLGLKNLAIYHDSKSRLTRQLAIAGLPTTLLIDRNGNEVGRVVGAAEWDSPAALELVRGYTEESPLKAAAE
ncbi:MAG: TlpA family protein disulfide reductase [Proteobacteria bacterium]|nr:TlpA family protein disulfide reductase [Pseudomonadota bacterium]